MLVYAQVQKAFLKKSERCDEIFWQLNVGIFVVYNLWYVCVHGETVFLLHAGWMCTSSSMLACMHVFF